ncbi:hypothetical protein F4811DRAFT_516525 [Daldinia bambusicola]|nr:hypothetical protein F4811DRAFT_516525 [Daldinia bambusicola]
MRPRKTHHDLRICCMDGWKEGKKTSQIPFLFCIAARHLLFFSSSILTNCSLIHIQTYTTHTHTHTTQTTHSHIFYSFCFPAIFP